jgi:hypothetical protein
VGDSQGNQEVGRPVFEKRRQLARQTSC